MDRMFRQKSPFLSRSDEPVKAWIRSAGDGRAVKQPRIRREEPRRRAECAHLLCYHAAQRILSKNNCVAHHGTLHRKPGGLDRSGPGRKDIRDSLAGGRVPRRRSLLIRIQDIAVGITRVVGLMPNYCENS